MLHVALAIAAIPACARVVQSSSRLVIGDGTLDVTHVAMALGAGVMVAATVTLAARAHARASASAKRAVTTGVGVGALFLLLVYANQIASALAGLGIPDYQGALPFPPAASTALRLLTIGLLLSVAVVRYQLLDMSLTARRRAGRTLVIVAILLMSAPLIVSGGATVAGVTFDAGHLVILVVVLLASTGFRRLVDRVTVLVYGVPPPGDTAAGVDAYRLAVGQAIREGRGVRDNPDLARLKDELGLDARLAAIVERAATPTGRGPLGPGQSVAGRYTITRFLGRGGSGRVFLARDTRLGRDVVVKEVLHAGGDGDVAPRALREARAASAIQHPNIVTVHDVIPLPDAWLIVTEYVPGGTLAGRVARDGPLPLSTGLPVLAGLVSALEALHAAGLVHQDVKPANVLLTRDEAPKLADFGIAKHGSGETWDGSVASFQGTPGFMAPEQRRGVPPAPAADVYAVGQIARACLRHPLPESMEAVIARALAEDPRERWEDAAALRRALARGVAVTPGTSGDTGPRR